MYFKKWLIQTRQIEVGQAHNLSFWNLKENGNCDRNKNEFRKIRK